VPAIVALAIEMATTCLNLQCLPRAGGLYDQSARDVFFLQVVNGALSERAEIERKAELEMKRHATR
jgi:hypothetical protein